MNGISGYLKNIGRAKAGIFAVLFLILFFGGLRAANAAQLIWQSCEVGTLATGIDYEHPYSRIAGYQFTPAKNGAVTKLCGYFNATRNVTLYDSSYSSLWTVSISSSNNWSCAAITPVNVASGASYFVMADSGYNGAYRYLPPYSLPLTCGSTTINNGVTEYLQESNPCLSTSFDSCYDVSTDYIEGMTDVEITYPDPPTLLSPTVSAVGTSVATLGAAITSDGGAAITARGTCWGTSPAPTTNCAAAGGTATGTFTQARTGLPPGTPLYYRGYAANGVATGYSPDGTFTTNVAVPTLTSPTVSSVSQTTAVLGANITNNGGGAITERGACWGTSPAPTTNCAAAGGTAMGVFTQSRTGLPTATLIYYRGYGKNSAGAGYSPDGSFTTLSNPSVSSITPAGAQNNATATISSITGTDFMSGIAVKLAKTGQADVACDGFTVINASALSSGECPITGVAAGYWNVVARNADSQTATLANGFNVSEACASTQGTIATSCIFPAAVGGVDNSNLVINSGATLTIGAGQTVVWNPGKQVVVNGSVAFVGSGQLKKTNLWAIDADSDGHSSDATLYAVDTAPAGGRRLQYITDFSDCNDNNVSVWANGYVAGADGDGDGYYASYSYGCNNGAASHGQTDCCDSDTRANPGAGGYYTTTDNCGSFDYNCNYVNELKDTQTSQCSVNYSNNICTFIRSEGWSEGVPACGQNGITSGYRVIEIEIIAPATCSDCGTALPQGNMLGTQACR